MKTWTLSCLLCMAAVLQATFAKPTQEKRDRVHHGRDLSDHVHNDAEDFQYDHEAFLGKEEAKTFDQLTPEESKERLGKIVDRIDKDKDGFITHSELHSWIKYTQKRYIEEDVMKHWREYDVNKDDKVSWEEYKNTTYGFYTDEEFEGVEDKNSYKAMLARDKRRFQMADQDGDQIATKEEFTAFLHPEEYEHMKNVVVQETIEDIDQNGDGFIDANEYIGDMYGSETEEEEPDWVKSERQQFIDFRDLNKDGKLDPDEVAHWILPGQVDHMDIEAKHLIYESDKDKDEKLTKEEVLGNWNMFVGSQATNYGEDLTKKHDEL